MWLSRYIYLTKLANLNGPRVGGLGVDSVVGDGPSGRAAGERPVSLETGERCDHKMSSVDLEEATQDGTGVRASEPISPQ